LPFGCRDVFFCECACRIPPLRPAVTSLPPSVPHLLSVATRRDRCLCPDFRYKPGFAPLVAAMSRIAFDLIPQFFPHGMPVSLFLGATTQGDSAFIRKWWFVASFPGSRGLCGRFLPYKPLFPHFFFCPPTHISFLVRNFLCLLFSRFGFSFFILIGHSFTSYFPHLAYLSPKTLFPWFLACCAGLAGVGVWVFLLFFSIVRSFLSLFCFLFSLVDSGVFPTIPVPEKKPSPFFRLSPFSAFFFPSGVPVGTDIVSSPRAGRRVFSFSCAIPRGSTSIHTFPNCYQNRIPKDLFLREILLLRPGSTNCICLFFCSAGPLRHFSFLF